MSHRALSSGITLSEDDASIVKGMLARGDRQHDIAAWFGVNAGRVAEIATGQRFRDVQAAGNNALPPPGPYPSIREAVALRSALHKARQAIEEAERSIGSR